MRSKSVAEGAIDERRRLLAGEAELLHEQAAGLVGPPVLDGLPEIGGKRRVDDQELRHVGQGHTIIGCRASALSAKLLAAGGSFLRSTDASRRGARSTAVPRCRGVRWPGRL